MMGEGRGWVNKKDTGKAIQPEGEINSLGSERTRGLFLARMVCAGHLEEVVLACGPGDLAVPCIC